MDALEICHEECETLRLKIVKLQADNRRLKEEKQFLMKLSHRPEKELNEMLVQALKGQ